MKTPVDVYRITIAKHQLTALWLTEPVDAPG